MRKTWNIWLGVATVAGLLVSAIGVAAARDSRYGQASQSQPPAAAERQTEDAGGYTTDVDAPAPVNAEEDAAYKAFFAVIPNDAAKKIELGEAFILKYPESRYRSPVYGALTSRTCKLEHAKDARSWRKRDCVDSE